MFAIWRLPVCKVYWEGTFQEFYRHAVHAEGFDVWYQEGANVQALLPTLSVYLGHVRPQEGYWYLTATPELLGNAAERFRLNATTGGERWSRDSHSSDPICRCFLGVSLQSSAGQPANDRQLSGYLPFAVAISQNDRRNRTCVCCFWDYLGSGSLSVKLLSSSKLE
jgi:hypothetical protein